MRKEGIDVFGISNMPASPPAVASFALNGMLSDGEIMHLAGNSFHLAAITSVLMFMFATLEAVPSS